ncbi:fibrinogen beta chain-like [Gigantopelta aegis]|uniref:fibrinogen beta chain-like n=1 Tax=Gigantopelta aegis TaxID=1735272 RepID=UPI001B88D622|nr:fibrinogen beta chain-like [Gigantopelta aegis]
MCPDGATDANCTRYLIDCNDYQGHDGTGRGLVYIKPVDWTGEPFLVVCLGGNTLIQMRDNVSSCYSFSFNRSWSEYREGFGDIQNGCFWLGNDKIAGITKSTLYYLILATEIDENITIVAEYYFMMKSASNNYQLRAVLKHISHLHSDGLDGPGTNMDVNNKYFYTYDNDKNGCAAAGGGGWWYDTGCAYGNLNGNWPRWPIQGTLKTLDVSWLLLQRH